MPEGAAGTSAEDQAAIPIKRPGSIEARHTLFATEYAATRNGTKAAAAAGYSAATGAVQASRLLSRPNIQTLVAECDADLIERTAVTKEWVVRETIHTYEKAMEWQQPAAARSCLASPEPVARLHRREEGHPDHHTM